MVHLLYYVKYPWHHHHSPKWCTCYTMLSTCYCSRKHFSNVEHFIKISYFPTETYTNIFRYKGQVQKWSSMTSDWHAHCTSCCHHHSPRGCTCTWDATTSTDIQHIHTVWRYLKDPLYVSYNGLLPSLRTYLHPCWSKTNSVKGLWTRARVLSHFMSLL